MTSATTLLIRLWKLLLIMPLLVVAAIGLGSRAIRAAIHHLRPAAAERDKFQPDGRRWPPHARALCDRCLRASRRVYHLPDGQRLCHDCYTALGLHDLGPRPDQRSTHAR